MKIFIRTSELAGAADHEINVIGYFEDDAIVAADVFGTGVTMLCGIAPTALAVKQELGGTGAPKLRADWRTQANVRTVMNAEAQQRINAVLPVEKRLDAMFEIITFIAQYGGDVNRWPPAARDRWLYLDQRFKYVQAVRQRADTFAEIPVNPVADNIWPTRL